MIFLFNDQWFLQTSGTAMGKNLCSLNTNIQPIRV